MPSTPAPSLRFASLPVAVLAMTVLAAPASAAGPFAGFAGRWTGGGTIQTSAGQEAIRCKARYTPTANAVHIHVNCASDSYRVDIVSDVALHGGALSGSWQETTRQISGDVSGRVSAPDTFQASLQALGGGIQLAARTDGKRQAITIRSQGSEIQGATITLKRT